jgi:hypothetical protein
VSPDDYLASIERLLATHAAVAYHDIAFDAVDESVCYLKGTAVLCAGGELHFAQLARVSETSVVIEKYRFHWTRPGAEAVRWDNAPHHRGLESFPCHRHDGDRVSACPAVTLREVLDFILESGA